MATRRTAKDRAKLRRHNEDLVRRSPILSTGAKVLWLELSRWAWDDPVCFPHQDLLTLSLGVSRYSITRWLKELQKHDLVLVTRLRRGNEYRLADEIPEAVCDSARGSNKQLLAMLRAEGHVADLPHEEAEDEEDELQIRTSHVADVQHDPRCHVADVPHPNVADLQHVDDEVHQEEVHQERGRRTREVREPREAAHDSEVMGEATKSHARSARDEGTESDGEQRTSDDKETEAEDPSELMEDPPPPRQAKKKPRKKNAPSSALVSPPAGRGLRDAGSPSKATKVVEATPPSMDDPDDVLALLRGEIEEKYGAKAAESLPMRLPPKERGQINKLLLDRYEPSVVIRMVRVLVWDWEIARAECFPPKTHMRYPRVEALAQYQEALSSVVDTGFTYSGGRRGEWNTYAMRYLKNANPSASADPF